jgi:adenosylmethionine-8-amino-7-oxononanoate aminotransferase
VLTNVRARAEQLQSLLDASVAKHTDVRAVRQRGLMVGVELAPPREGLRWGRRVCAASVERGVLLRPLGDVVVLMPILTSTSDEIERIAQVLADSIAEVTAE